ncbi:MAG: hypothetical protein UZ07_CHB004002809 [Chlorobi bacterium OLB7]|nr:MAG: hypothetical protein UZ07_CHB004002809 [Chlorobi bacterium OLB7]
MLRDGFWPFWTEYIHPTSTTNLLTKFSAMFAARVQGYGISR